jgi:tetratricopeptide (TPR) repeat protein
LNNQSNLQLPLATQSFVGRERELAELRLGLEDSIAGHGRLFMVSGEPGIGKTRLAAEAASGADEKGVKVIWGRCWEGDGVPGFWPWIQILSTFAETDEGSELLAKMGRKPTEAFSGSLRDSDGPRMREARGLRSSRTGAELHSVSVARKSIELIADPAQAQFDLFISVSAFLKGRAGRAPLMLILDDLHDADQSSLALLGVFVRELHESRIMLIVTYREAEVRLSATLSSAIGKLGREGHQLPLRGLSESEVGGFLEHRAGAAPAAELVALLHQTTSGNPLFLDGVVRMLLAEGKLGDRQDVGQGDFRLPDGVQLAVRASVNLLSERAQSLLSLAATLGIEFDLSRLKAVTGSPHAVLLQILDEIVRAGIVVEIPESMTHYRFAHALIRATVYDGLGSAARVRLHRQIGDALERMYIGDFDPHIDELAYHFSRAIASDTTDKAIDYSIRAGQLAYNVYAYDRAGSYWRAALRMMPASDTQPTRRAKVLHFLADELISSGPEVVAYLDSALPLLESLGEINHIADTHLRLGLFLSGGHFDCLDMPRAIEEFGKAETALKGQNDKARLISLYTNRAAASGPCMQFRDGLEFAGRVMSLSEEPGYEGHWAVGAMLASHSLLALGRLAESRTLELKAQDKCERLEDALSGSTVAWLRGGNSEDLLDFREALNFYLAELARPRTSRSVARSRILKLLAGGALSLVGELPEARRMLLAALRTVSDMPWQETLAESLLEFIAGNWDGFDSLISKTLDRVRHGGNLSGFSQRTFLLGENSHYRGRYEEAEARLRQSLTATQAAPNLPRAINAQQQLCLLYFDMNRRDDASRGLMYCREILAGGEDWRGLAGTVARAEAVVAALDRRFDDADSHFETALQILHRYSAVWMEANTLLYWGRALIRAGDSTRAIEKLEAAISIYRRIGAGQPWIDRVVSDMPPATITPHPRRLPSLRREGEYWTLSGSGEVSRIRDSRGVRYIAHLLEHPHEQISSVDLSALALEHPPDQRSAARASEGELVPDLGGASTILDAQAIAEYRRRMGELRDEIDEGEHSNDIGAVDRARTEFEMLSQQLRTGVGLNGRARTFASHRERARVTVTKRIKVAIEKIRASDPALGRHLANSIHTGNFCCYSPTDAAAWQS